MTKNKNKKRRVIQQLDPSRKRARHETLFSSSFPSSTRAPFVNELPLHYPHSPSLPIPTNEFLRDVDPYKKSFKVAVDTSYLGFAIDKLGQRYDTNTDNEIDSDKKGQKKKCPEQAEQLFDHDIIEKALLSMDKHGLFRTDVTQPFGLGTKCARTYVTRCLLGEEGTTYKYLGLRMFAHPWKWQTNQNHHHHNNAKGSKNKKNPEVDTEINLDQALGLISQLNDSLTQRTSKHLDSLDRKRRENYKSEKGLDTDNIPRMVKGRSKFDIALINRMVNTSSLKKEPSMGDGRCSVSWHADSTLENYSSIAVYHTILNETKPNHRDSKSINKKEEEQDLSDRWSIALRVAHNSEGPSSSKRGTDIESAIVSNTPPIAVSLPSRSAYYLLDDFNHHHQHAVIVNDDNFNNKSSAGVRFASTHRLLREGHNVHFIIERCRNACAQFHKKGLKLWRSEQLLLTEIESEWIRQFFIQGEGHKTNLWKYWKEPICHLLYFWSRLEQRTKQVLDLLRFAAQERCAVGDNEQRRMKRKERDKQKKSLASLEDIISRGNEAKVVDSNDTANSLYLSICNSIEERAKMRKLWKERENDHVFKSMDTEYKPIEVPFVFNVSAISSAKGNSAEVGESHLDGSHEGLLRISQATKQYGVAFLSRNKNDLFHDIGSSNTSTKEDSEKKSLKDNEALEENDTQNKIQKMPTSETKVIKVQNDPTEHKKDHAWSGWGSHVFALEMQHPWAGLLFNGKKNIETRAYNLPKTLIGKKMFILESQPGEDRVSSLKSIIPGNELNKKKVKIAGWVIFDKVITYRYRAKFESDEKKHLVKKDSAYGWNEDTSIIYGWVVSKRACYTKSGGNQHINIHSLIRRMRSLYEIKKSTGKDHV